jgi:tetratricopeptide (TPR) repeat protein
MAALDELEAMGDIAMIHLRLGNAEASAAKLDEMAALVESADISDEARTRDRALVANLTGMLKLEQRNFEQAAAGFEEAITLDPNYKQQLYRMYTRMIRLGDPARAIAFIKRDQRNQIRAGFWHGVALDRLGESDEAIRHWQKVLNVDLAANEEPHLLEYILAHYYLGDAEGAGLGLVLNALQEETGGQWALFLLAGIGWAQRDNVENARTNFFTAMNQRRANGNGLLLPWESWNFLLDLLPEEDLANYAEFFETEHQLQPVPAAEVPTVRSPVTDATSTSVEDTADPSTETDENEEGAA